MALSKPVITSGLCSAVARGDGVGVAIAIGEGADSDTCMSWEFTEEWGGKLERVPILTVAAYKGYSEVVSALLEANVNTELRGDFELTPLTTAISLGHTGIVEKLLIHGADVNSRNSISGGLPIHLATGYGYVKIAQVLQAHGSPLDAVANLGQTPLHHAAWCGQNITAEWLVQEGVDVATVTNNGNTAADVAEYMGHTDLAAWLRNHERSASGCTAAADIFAASTADVSTSSSAFYGAADPTTTSQDIKEDKFTARMCKMDLYKRCLNHPLSSSIELHWALKFVWHDGYIATHEAVINDDNGMLKPIWIHGGPEHRQQWCGFKWSLCKTPKNKFFCSPTQVKEEAKRLGGVKYEIMRTNCQSFATDLAKKFGVKLIDDITNQFF